jgi:hypothetical protein
MTTTGFDTETCAPDPPAMTVDQAHTAMQDHLSCATDACPTRRAALSTLVSAGRLVLAARR